MATVMLNFFTDKFFKKILVKQTKCEDVKIISIDIRPGAEVGEQFMSSMFKVKIVYDFDTGKAKFEVNWIIKLKPVDDSSASTFLKQYPRAFETEIAMYKEVLPRIREMFEKNNIMWKISPELIYEDVQPTPMLVFEDVSYRMGFTPHTTPLNFDDTKKVVKKLALFHAASLFLDEGYYQSMIYFERGVGDHNPINTFLVPTCDMYMKYFEERPELNDLCKKLQKLRTTFESKITEIYKSKQNPSYKVLNHGDLSVRNLLFNIAKGTFNDVLFIDFQLSQWGSPAIDIFYILFTVASHDVRVSFRDDIINFYYDEFTKALTHLKYNKPLPSKDALDYELKSCQILEAMLILGLSVFQYADFQKLNMKEIIANNNFYKISLSALENQQYIDQLNNVLTRLSHKND